MRTAKPKPEFIVCPFTILIDTREQLPYTFAGIRADAKQRRLPVLVQSLRGTIASGDYSIVGLSDAVAVERKSKEDLFGTLGGGRERFERELQRLNSLEFAAVVVECEWSDVFGNPPKRSGLTPKTVFRSVNAWEQRYTRVHWCFCPGREFAEAKTFRILERFYNTHMQRGNDRVDAMQSTAGND
jgi:DNA excision repair protein ERCC-4